MAALNTPETHRYQKTDEYVFIEGANATIGISDYAQDALNDIVYIELPALGDTLTKGQRFGAVESVKAASELYAPVSGTITAVNTALEAQPELINADPYGKGWILRITVKDASEANDLMDAAAYLAFNQNR